MAGGMNGVGLQKFWNMVKDSSVLDGDVVLRGTDLKKVNFGGSFARFFNFKGCTARTQGTEGQDARNSFFQALTNAVNLENTSLSGDAQNKVWNDIRSALGIATSNDRQETANKPLSRRTIRQVFDKLHKAIGEPAFKDLHLQGAYKISAKAKGFGGGKGLALTESQFKGIFQQIKSRGYDDFKTANDKSLREPDLQGLGADDAKAKKKEYEGKVALRKKAFDSIIDTCLNMYKTGKSYGKLEEIFSKGLDIDSIGQTLKEYADEGKCLLREPSNQISGGAKQKDDLAIVAKNLDELHKAEEAEGHDAIAQKVKISYNSTDAQNALLKTDADKCFVANLILNENPLDVKAFGLSGGERLGRILLDNPKLFYNLCKRVRQDDYNVTVTSYLKSCAQNGTDPDPVYKVIPAADLAEADALLSLEKMDKDLAEGLRALIRQVSEKFFSGAIGHGDAEEFGNVCQVNMQKIFDMIGKATVAKDARNRPLTMEGLIDNRLMALIKEKDDNSLRSGILNEFGANSGDITSSQVELMKDAVENAFNTTDKNAIRRMFAAGLRYPQNGEKFDPNAMLIGSAPYLLKVLQGTGTEEGLRSGMSKVLAVIRGDLPPIGTDVVRATLFAQIKNIEGVESVDIKTRLGAASIGETFFADIKYANGKTESVVFKLQRPGVEERFKAEAKSIGTFLANMENVSDSQKSECQNNLRSISNEFDFKKEVRNAIRGIAAYGLSSQKGEEANKIANRVSSMGLVYKTSEEEFLADIAKAKLTGLTDDVLDGILEKHILGSQKNCMLSKKADGLTVDQLVAATKPPTLNELREDYSKKDENGKDLPIPLDVIKGEMLNKLMSKCQPLFEARRALLALVYQTIKSLQNDNPPYIHGDMHGGNLVIKDGSVTMIDHGKAIAMTQEEQKDFRGLIKVLNCQDREVTGGEGEQLNAYRSKTQVVNILNVYRNFLQAEGAALKTDDPGKAKIENYLNDIGTMLAKLGDEGKWGERLPGSYGDLVKGLASIGETGLDGLLAFRNVLSQNEAPIPYTLSETLATLQKLNESIKTIENAIGEFKATYYQALFDNLKLDGEKILMKDTTIPLADLQKTLDSQVKFVPDLTNTDKYYGFGSVDAYDANSLTQKCLRIIENAAKENEGKEPSVDALKELANTLDESYGATRDDKLDNLGKGLSYWKASKSAKEGQQVVLQKYEKFELERYTNKDWNFLKVDITKTFGLSNDQQNYINNLVKPANGYFSALNGPEEGQTYSFEQYSNMMKNVQTQMKSCEDGLKETGAQIVANFNVQMNDLGKLEGKTRADKEKEILTNVDQFMWSRVVFNKSKVSAKKALDGLEKVNTEYFGGAKFSLTQDKDANDSSLSQVIDKVLGGSGTGVNQG